MLVSLLIFVLNIFNRRRQKRAESHKKAAADAIEDLSAEEAEVLALTEKAFKKYEDKVAVTATNETVDTNEHILK